MSGANWPSTVDILNARAAISGLVFRTPLRPSSAFSATLGCDVHLKLENWQPTGSFKVRGAANFLSQLGPEERRRGVVTSSAGNHGLAVGYAAEKLNLRPVTVFLPETAPLAKIEKLKRFPLTVCQAGQSYAEAHAAAEEFQKANDLTFVHPYDDPRTIAGAGTLGLEILEDWPEVEAILVPVGGGGLISGVTLAVKSIAPNVQIYGVQPEASPALRDSLRDGHAYLEYLAGPTICDGLAGGIGQTGFEVAQKYVEDVLVVSEDAVKRAVAAFVRDEQMVVEGSGAVGLAALEGLPPSLKGKRVALVISGANIDARRLAGIVEQLA